MITISGWKERLDEAHTLEEAESIVDDALSHSDSEELATFLIDLFDEFVGPDPLGGELGTKQRIVRIFNHLATSGYDLAERFQRELRDYKNLLAVIRHG